ncbi:DUF4238 domain-containing protein [Sulfitobacter sp. KE29]|uniref:DUF4238 domain-containing protein n=1 Tax=unclassified Sulfitobacter TaxID=196795 RepID=UPI0023E0A045|nr:MULTISPECIES: DUF4238 domain-containing protein [unclassified Sulfitobacter]MDF3419095.1 DUF4238 domain-containing protein [Sulfitobacter sp. Ks38]MDF3426577.1 DUF4238 domain-containing protein [Sulfitobacter sp. KE29]MDF3430158.1 DUF4238 domain-containing protein [Sulfitobacter sp. S46]MDF3444930.1 DUF4238 domain-containing protein [Sulfitobacter sp. KE31]MDF3548955.1 DUF4238 domain-containing protein [Sulfitobacter sp. KE28]
MRLHDNQWVLSLDGSPEERMMLGVFVAFQLLRTRAYRDQMNTLFKGVQNHLKKLGLPEHELAVMDDLSDKRLAQSHLESLRSSIEKFSSIIATKDFLLLQAPNDKAFYLSDNPVALHNDEGKEGFFGNIGLSVKGIQLYIPLSSRFMLAALCPSILASFRTTFEENKKSAQQVKAMLALSPTAYGSKRIELEAHLSLLKDSLDKVESFIRAANEGTPLIATGETMEFYNSLQVASAREFVVCEKGDFRLAKRFVDREGPGGGGLKLKMG